MYDLGMFATHAGQGGEAELCVGSHLKFDAYDWDTGTALLSPSVVAARTSHLRGSALADHRYPLSTSLVAQGRRYFRTAWKRATNSGVHNSQTDGGTEVARHNAPATTFARSS
jgi:hypothetical protein